MRKNHDFRKWHGIGKILITIVILMTLTACGSMTVMGTGRLGVKNSNTKSSSELTVHYMDVGQGDAILISCKGEYMLIDAGDNNQGTAVQNYLTKQGVKTLKYVVGTHPDADHIGGMDVVLYKFDCQTVMMPDVVNDTATYRDVLDTMKTKGYRNTVPVAGRSYTLGDAGFTIAGPTKSYEDTNNNSIVIRLTHGDNSFLFTGDMEEEAESDILSGKGSVKADVLKVGHHGSRSSSSEAFLEAVAPSYAVISCGEDNSYGHPHAQTLNTLRRMGVQVFRTDEQGTVTASSDGSQITWNCAPSDTWKAGESTQSQGTVKQDSQSTQNQNAADQSVRNQDTRQIENTAPADTAPAADAPSTDGYIGNRRNQKLHRSTCHTLPAQKNQVPFQTKEEAVAAGYDDPCGNCKP